MNICIIPARGGSKRIPRKNIKPFLGKPIISYSIKAAFDSNCFDRIIVSTDDNEISGIAKKYGAEVPFLRPIELSGDYVDTISVIQHAIDWLEKEGVLPKKICCLYAAAPFVSADAIKKAYEKMVENQASYCFSVTSFPSPIQRAIRLTQDGSVCMFQPENYTTRSQDFEEAYHDAGQFYWGMSEAFKQKKPIFSKDAIPYILPRYLTQDIDTKEDWIRAEIMYKVLKNVDTSL